MERRQFFLGALGVLLAPGLVSAIDPAMAGIKGGVARSADRLLAACSRRSSAAVVGQAYLDGLDVSPNVDQVVDALMSRLGLSEAGLERMSRQELKRSFKACSSEDFSAGRTVQLEGWILADTEAKLYGLAALRPEVQRI